MVLPWYVRILLFVVVEEFKYAAFCIIRCVLVVEMLVKDMRHVFLLVRRVESVSVVLELLLELILRPQ